MATKLHSFASSQRQPSLHSRKPGAEQKDCQDVTSHSEHRAKASGLPKPEGYTVVDRLTSWRSILTVIPMQNQAKARWVARFAMPRGTCAHKVARLAGQLLICLLNVISSA